MLFTYSILIFISEITFLIDVYTSKCLLLGLPLVVDDVIVMLSNEKALLLRIFLILRLEMLVHMDPDLLDELLEAAWASCFMFKIRYRRAVTYVAIQVVQIMYSRG